MSNQQHKAVIKMNLGVRAALGLLVAVVLCASGCGPEAAEPDWTAGKGDQEGERDPGCGNIAGCCKQRPEPTADDQRFNTTPPWYRIGDCYQVCKELNAEVDGDNVFHDEGLIYWDLSC